MAKAKFDLNNVLNTQTEAGGETGTLDSLFADDFGYDILSNEKESGKLMAMSKEIAIDKVKPSPRNPYKVLDNDDMDTLVASIKSEGILNPLVARPVENGEYELVSGHRRLHAAKKLGLAKVPVVIREMTSEQADVWMVDLNLNRETILPSEKAKAVKLKYDAIKKTRGGSRNVEATGHNSAEIVAEEMGMSKSNLKRYLALANLCDELMEKVDSGSLIMISAVELSYLTPDVQKKVNEYIDSGKTVSQGEAKQLKINFAGVQEISDKNLEKVLKGKTKKPEKIKSVLTKVEKSLKSKTAEYPTKEKDIAAVREKIEDIRKELAEIEKKLS